VQRLFPGTPMISPSGGAAPGLRNGTVNPSVGSFNWAGYAVHGRIGAFRSVSAAWTEPKVNCQGVRVHSHRFSSFWVGLDGFPLPGQLPPPNLTVEQLGTDADCSGHFPVYFAWWEMYPSPSVNLSNPVRPGDHMSASVTFRGAGRYALFIKDSTRHWSRTIVTSHGGLRRSSAEVIAEAPSLLIPGNPLPVPQNLANFGTVQWTGSRVNGTLLKNIGGKFRITMFENKFMPLIRATTSLVSSADAFTNTYRRCC
jgi:hypothetical protein